MNKHKYNTPQTNNNSGFTIIEVVLVLAIAGLIFLMVFIALPALQRNQRDTQRKNNLNLVVDALNRYTANNPGQTLESEGSYITNLIASGYLGRASEFVDPDGDSYTARIGEFDHELTEQHRKYYGQTAIYKTLRARCDGSDVIPKDGTDSVALRIVLEGGGVYCVNN